MIGVDVLLIIDIFEISEEGITFFAHARGSLFVMRVNGSGWSLTLIDFGARVQHIKFE